MKKMDINRIAKKITFRMVNVDIEATIEKPLDLSHETQPYVKNLHDHFMYELFFVGDDSLTVYTESETLFFNNSIVCIPPFCMHNTFRNNGQRILFSFVKRKGEESGLSKFMDVFFSQQEPFEIETNNNLLCYCNALSDIFSFDADIVSEVAVSALKLFFFTLYTAYATPGTSLFSTSESYIVQIEEIISNFSNDINLQTIAEALHLSTKQVSRIIRKNYKKKLATLVTEKRLTVAAELLSRSDKSILEIVEYINFSSESYFYSQFKKMFDCTPAQYKKMHQQK